MAWTRSSRTRTYSNVGSWRVMEKLGMTREGLFRSHSVARGVRQDEVYYGLLREERDASET